jgi:hypothetical protein
MDPSVFGARLRTPWILVVLALVVAFAAAHPHAASVAQMYARRHAGDDSTTQSTHRYSRYYECSQDADAANRWNISTTFTYCREETVIQWGW